MAAVGDLITTTLYNTLYDELNEYWGDNYNTNTPANTKAENSKGWGQTAIPSLVLGDVITTDSVNEFINRVNLSVQQTGIGTSITKKNLGDLIEASTYNDIQTQNTSILADNTAANDFTITSAGTDGSATRASWTNTITVTITATFASYNEARYFFNSGGQLRYSFSNSGTTNDALAWQDLFDGTDMGTLAFGYEDIIQTGTRFGIVAANSGFYELTTTPQQWYGINLDTSPYTDSDLSAEFSRSADGTQVIVTFNLKNDDPQSETVDGNTVVYLDTRKADNKSAATPTVNFTIAPPSTHSAGAWSGS